MSRVVYVDLEHPRIRDDAGERGRAHRAKRSIAGRRLAGLAGADCLVRPFEDVSPWSVATLAPSAIVLSGSTADWAEYDFGELRGLLETIRCAPVPILGICAGHQLVGYAHGAAWGPLGSLDRAELDPDPRFAPGLRKERGFVAVQVDPRSPLFHGLGPEEQFFESHYWHLRARPDGFIARASTPWSPIQAIERRDRPVFGVQFHPERHDSVHPAGRVLLRNFFALARSASDRTSGMVSWN